MHNSFFLDVTHAQQYLNGCIILLNNKPIYVDKVLIGPNRSLVIRYCPSYSTHLEEEYSENLTIKDQRLDFNPFPMGYVNHEDMSKNIKAVRLFRMPSRTWKVGLTTNNLVVAEGTTRQVMFTKAFYNTVVGVFPTLNKSLSLIEKGSDRVAFSRYFAVNKKQQLLYLHNEEYVGVIEDKKLHLLDTYKYLTELLEKELEGYSNAA